MSKEQMRKYMTIFIWVAAILVCFWLSYMDDGQLKLQLPLGSEFAEFIGYLIGGGLLILQIFVSNRRATAAENTAEAMQKTTDLTAKGNIAEQFKNANEHLGSNSASVRLGGIYLLHHMAQEEKKYKKQVFKILCAYTRVTTTQKKYWQENLGDEIKPTLGNEIKPTIEIQNILDLLFCKGDSYEEYDKKENIYEEFEAILERSLLHGSYLVSANLRGANLVEANLQEANLAEANLQQAKLWKANLQGAILVKANLQQATLWQADLQKADLWKAKLLKANLWKTNLQEADLQETDLQEADLQEADLTNVKNLKVEQLSEAKTLYKAKLPDGMEEEIKKIKPELFERPKVKQEF